MTYCTLKIVFKPGAHTPSLRIWNQQIQRPQIYLKNTYHCVQWRDFLHTLLVTIIRVNSAFKTDAECQGLPTQKHKLLFLDKKALAGTWLQDNCAFLQKFSHTSLHQFVNMKSWIHMKLVAVSSHCFKQDQNATKSRRSKIIHQQISTAKKTHPKVTNISKCLLSLICTFSSIYPLKAKKSKHCSS